jgi:SRSO17 transposase
VSGRAFGRFLPHKLPAEGRASRAQAPAPDNGVAEGDGCTLDKKKAAPNRTAPILLRGCYVRVTLSYSRSALRLLLVWGASEGRSEDSCLLLDESSFQKKGRKSVGVARQWSGRLGKVENCQVVRFLLLWRKGITRL